MSINKELNKITVDLQRQYDRLEAVQQHVTAEMLKNSYQGTGTENKLMSEAWKEYNEILLQRVNAKKPTMNEDTQERFVITSNKVASFIKHSYRSGDKLLRDFPQSFGNDFFHYLTTKDELCKNIAMKYLKNTKQMLKWAAKRGYVKSSPLADFRCTYKDPKRPRQDAMIMFTIFPCSRAVNRLK